MVWFESAQPALLYLVPGLTIFSVIPALIRGEFDEMWKYDSGVAEKSDQKTLPETPIEMKKIE